MSGKTIVLLPGLDGTANLVDRFVSAAPAGFRVLPIAFPADRVLTYDDLAELVLPALPPGQLVLLGESFSGPLALRLARQVRPAAVILCASFVRASTAARFSAGLLSRLCVAPPTFAVRSLLAGGDRIIATELVRALSPIDPRVMGSRVRMVLEVDARADLAACPCPVLYLRSTEDRVVGSRQAAIVRRERPDVEIADVAGPHLLLQVRPRECWQTIAVFLARLGFVSAQRV